MSDAVHTRAFESNPVSNRQMPLLYGLIAFVVISIIIAKLVPVLDDWPLEWLVPARAWVTDFFVWFSAAVKPVTRAISWVLAQPLALVEAILYRGVPDWNLQPLPWIATVFGTGLLGHWIGGRKLGLFSGACAIYLAIFGLWPDAMKTLAIVVVTVPIAATAGLLLGVWERATGVSSGCSTWSLMCCKQRRIWLISDRW